MLGVKKLPYLGYRLSAAGVAPDPDKVSGIQSWPVPICAHDIQVFLGMTGFMLNL